MRDVGEEGVFGLVGGSGRLKRCAQLGGALLNKGFKLMLAAFTLADVAAGDVENFFARQINADRTDLDIDDTAVLAPVQRFK